MYFDLIYVKNIRASLIPQLVKNPSAVQKTLVHFLGREDPLEKGKTTDSSILAREFQELYNPQGCEELDMTERLTLSHQNIFIFHNILGSHFHMPNTGGDTCWQRSFHSSLLLRCSE